jgi:hypothetical protein
LSWTSKGSLIAVLGELSRAKLLAEGAFGREVREAHAAHRRRDPIAFLLELDLGDLLGLAVGLAAGHHRLLGGHRHGDEVHALLAVVAHLHAEHGRSDGHGVLWRQVHADVGEGAADQRPADRLEGLEHERPIDLRIRLVLDADLAHGALHELRVLLLGLLHLLQGLHIAKSCHRGPPSPDSKYRNAVKRPN